MCNAINIAVSCADAEEKGRRGVMGYILTIDEGSTSTKALLVDSNTNVIASFSREIKTIHPKQGWVEHDAEEIWTATLECMRQVMSQTGIDAGEIQGVGITNQRETFVLWERGTGKLIGNAISWQCKRGAGICESIRRIPGAEDMVHARTGLYLDSYFTASKLVWKLENTPGLRERCEKGEIAFGTLDSYLIHCLTKGRLHATDASNASRTLLYNIVDRCWDQELISLWDIPAAILPQVNESSFCFGKMDAEWLGKEIMIAGCIGDAQGALFGQCAFQKGMAKNTYGTAANFDINIGEEFLLSEHKLQTTVAWVRDGKCIYALEGGIYVSGSVVDWMQNTLGIVKNGADATEICTTVEDTDGVYLVPAFVGLGAPHWDEYARGCISGLSNTTTTAHIVRAGMESIVYQVNDVMRAAEIDLGFTVNSLRVDGGTSKSEFVMQFQADISNVEVICPVTVDTTALGAAFLAGLAVGMWEGTEQIEQLWQAKHIYRPQMDPQVREDRLKGWKKAVARATL